MSATLQRLLDQARRRLEALPPNEVATQAMPALAHVARALTELATDGVGNRVATVQQRAVTDALAQQCLPTRAWLPATRTAADLVGAAADLAARWAPELSPLQRWAIVVAFAETAHDAATAAARHPAWARQGALAKIRAAALAIEQHAASDPPSPAASTVLDRSVAAVQLDGFLPPAALAARTGVALIDHVRSATASRALTISDALAAVSAARYAAAQAVAFADGVTRTDPVRQPWRDVPAAWLAVDIAYAPFDDGTKHTRPDNPVRSGAIRFYGALRDANLAFATMPPGIALPQQATLLRGLADQLPELAAVLLRRAHDWAQNRALLAPERRLRRSEDRERLAGRPDRVVTATTHDLTGVRTALLDAHRLSAALAAHLDHLTPGLGRQPHPHLAAAHHHIAAALRPGAIDRRARSAHHRLALDPPSQWGFVRTPPPRRGR